MASITNTSEQKAAALTALGLTEDMIGHSNYLAGHIILQEGESDFTFSAFPFFNNIKNINARYDVANNKLQFIAVGVDSSTAITFNDSGNRLVSGI